MFWGKPSLLVEIVSDKVCERVDTAVLVKEWLKTIPSPVSQRVNCTEEEKGSGTSGGNKGEGKVCIWTDDDWMKLDPFNSDEDTSPQAEIVSELSICSHLRTNMSH